MHNLSYKKLLYVKTVNSYIFFKSSDSYKDACFPREVLALSTPWRAEYGDKLKFWKINPLTRNILVSSINLKGLDFGASFL